MDKGKVYLIGAGPGDPGLLTLKAKRLLEQADVVVYDRLVGDDILAMAGPASELIYVGKVSGKHALSQEEINKVLVEKAAEGKSVARLKGGDPFLYGRGGEEAMYIRENGFDYEVVPGITSAIAVPAYAGIPVTHRDATSSFAVITGHEKPGKKESSICWDKISTGIGTLVFLMGVENLPYICEELVKNGREASTPVALVRWGTRPAQEVLTGTLENIVDRVRETGFRPPAVIVVGEVVALRRHLSWIEQKPLWGKKIIVTRARAQASLLVEKIGDCGGQALEVPVIRIEKETNLSALSNAFKNLEHYGWIIFTSVNAVEIFFEELFQQGFDIRDLKGISIAAIGPATRQSIENRGIRVDVQPDEFRAEGILEDLEGRIQPGQWVLLPRAQGARGILPETLRNRGAHVNEVPLYQAMPGEQPREEILQQLWDGNIDYITFTSSSTVHNFVAIAGKENITRIKRNTRIACIGPVTADTARGYGFQIDVTAPQYTIEGLINAIIADVQTQQTKGIQ